MRLAKNISQYSIHQIFAEQNVHAYLDDKAYVSGSPVCTYASNILRIPESAI